MTDEKAMETMLQISQRCIEYDLLDTAYRIMRVCNVTDDQIRTYCSDYFVHNTCGYNNENGDKL